MQTIWIKQRWPYVAVRPVCDINRNWGAIEKSFYQGPMRAGRLYLQPGLQRLQSHTGFQVSPNGHGPRNAGSGYLGWIDFGSVGQAIDFLKQHYNVLWCPTGGVMVTGDGLHIPIPTIPTVDSDKHWGPLKTHVEDLHKRGHKITRVVFRGGGTIPIPDDFREWCKANGITIEVIDDPEFDDGYPPECWADEDGSPYVCNIG